MVFSVDNLPELEKHLAQHQYLSGADKPNAEDATIFQALQAKNMVPQQTQYPALYAWYGWLNMFSPAKVASWAGAQAAPAKKAAAKKEEPKQEDDDVDLFGDDDEDPEEEAERERKRLEIVKAHQAKKGKKTVVAKTIFIFDVKVFEIEQDLDALAKRIYTEVQMDGLVWNQEPKFEPIAFGMRKLVVSCVLEDEKVSSEDIIDQIQGWEDDVQSVDVASMQKL